MIFSQGSNSLAAWLQVPGGMCATLPGEEVSGAGPLWWDPWSGNDFDGTEIWEHNDKLVTNHHSS